MKRAFTIVELLVVVAILGILLGIIGVAVTGSIKNGREKRADMMRAAFEQAIAAYYAQEGKWPGVIETKAQNMGDKNIYVLEPGQIDDVLREIVRGSVGANASRPLIDASALFVAETGNLKNGGMGCFDNHGNRQEGTFCGDQHCINGKDFSLAVKKHVRLSNMSFGYQGKNEGKFCRFWLSYNGRTDSVSVSLGKPDEEEN